MRTPDGRWTVDTVEQHGRTSFLVRRRDQPTAASTEVRGTIVPTLDQVCELLGDEFELLVDD